VGCVGLTLVGWWISQPRPDGTPRRAPAPAPVRWFACIGLWSYSIYLWHQPSAQILALKVRARVFARMDRAHLDPWHSPWQYFISAAIYLTIAVGIGAVAYYLIERPALKLRDRVLGRWGMGAQPQAAADVTMPREPGQFRRPAPGAGASPS
jgi:peptidoglycan/LPS O-acetylase OafA/YrhL